MYSSAPRTSTRRSPTAVRAASRRRSARWPRGSAPTSNSTSFRASTPGSSRGRSGSPRPRSAWWWPLPPQHLDALTQRCDRVGVDVADIGSFTGDGRLVVRNGGDTVVDIDTTFLHDGRPQRRMQAELPTPNRTDRTTRTVDRSRRHPARAAGAPEHRLEGRHDPPVRPRDPRIHGGPTAGRGGRRRSRRWGGPRRANRNRGHRDRDRRQSVVRPARSRSDGLRRGRRSDAQRGRRRRRP